MGLGSTLQTACTNLPVAGRERGSPTLLPLLSLRSLSYLWLREPEGQGRRAVRLLPFSRPVISTESREGGMALVAKIQSPTFFSFLYSTRKDWIGKPPLPRGIQVTYTEVSDAIEMVGLSGASGAGERSMCWEVEGDMMRRGCQPWTVLRSPPSPSATSPTAVCHTFWASLPGQEPLSSDPSGCTRVLQNGHRKVGFKEKRFGAPKFGNLQLFLKGTINFLKAVCTHNFRKFCIAMSF